jgi:isopentenyl-diphosphate Delta-isomerase
MILAGEGDLGPAAEDVVLVDEDGNGIGTAPKAEVHHTATPLHLAFSCYVFDRSGQVLVTRRATTKLTWPGVWTNSCCGHPLPGEPVADSVARRLEHELGIVADRVDLVLPRFRYRAVMDDGLVENELCPVFRAVAGDAVPRALPSEVAETRWMPWTSFTAVVTAGEFDVSPWCREQVPELIGLGADPLRWPAADADELPAAARG